MINKKLKYRTLTPVKFIQKINEPFTEVKDGYGYLGVLLEDDLEEKIQCHVCGELFRKLSTHIKSKHKMSTSEYKYKFGLNQSTGLVSTELGKRLSLGSEFRYKLCKGILNSDEIKRLAQKKAKEYRNTETHKKKRAMWHTVEMMNKYGTCPAQVEERFIKIVDEIGRAPTYTEMIERDWRLLSVLVKRYKGYTNTLIYFGLTNKKQQTHPVWSKKSIIFSIKQWVKEEKRLPNPRDTKLGALPDYMTIVKHLGSWWVAKKIAFDFLKKTYPLYANAYDDNLRRVIIRPSRLF